MNQDRMINTRLLPNVDEMPDNISAYVAFDREEWKKLAVIVDGSYPMRDGWNLMQASFK